MTATEENISLTFLHDKANYQIDDLDSEIHADRLCAALLKNFHQFLLHEGRLEPLEAGSQAAGADYFLREFMIGYRRDNIYNGSAKLTQQFAGHWYIINTLEPNIDELAAILNGTVSFYRYCAEKKLITMAAAEQLKKNCNRIDYYRQRIEDFHNITGAGYNDWKKACPLD